MKKSHSTLSESITELFMWVHTGLVSFLRIEFQVTLTSYTFVFEKVRFRVSHGNGYSIRDSIQSHAY